MKSGLSTFSGTITIVTSMLGVGINFMPAGFKSVGYMNAIILMLFIAAITFFSLYAVAYAAHVKQGKDTTYASLGADISLFLGYAVNFSIILAQFGVGVAFYKYLVKLVVLFFHGIDVGHKDEEYYRRIYILGLGLLLWGLSLMKNLSSLRFTSYLSVGSVIYLSVLMIIFNFYIGDSVQEGGFNASNSDWSYGISFFILAMCCQINMVKIYMELEEKTIQSIVLISSIGSVVGAVVYGVVGFFGYRVFGEGIKKEDLMVIFSKSDSRLNEYLRIHYPLLKYSTSIAVIGAMFVLFGSFPLQLNPASTTLLKMICAGEPPERVRVSIISVLFLSMVLINLVPGVELGKILSFMGATLNNSMSFLFPSIYYLKSSKRSNFLSFFSFLTILISISSGVYMVYDSIRKN